MPCDPSDTGVRRDAGLLPVAASRTCCRSCTAERHPLLAVRWLAHCLAAGAIDSSVRQLPPSAPVGPRRINVVMGFLTSCGIRICRGWHSCLGMPGSTNPLKESCRCTCAIAFLRVERLMGEMIGILQLLRTLWTRCLGMTCYFLCVAS